MPMLRHAAPFLAAPIAIAAMAATATAAAPPRTSVTVYSSADPAGFDPQRFVVQQRRGQDPAFAWGVPGFGVVKTERTIVLEAGRNEVNITDVAEFIDPTTVGFLDLTDPATTVLEQGFRFDLVSPAKLLERYLDSEIVVVREGPQRIEEIRGTLLSASAGQLVLRNGDGVRIVPLEGSQVALPSLPGGLLTKPALAWSLQAASGGEHRVRVSYQTGGMTWRSDYNLVLGADETTADLNAWVSLMNLSGIGFEEVRLKLVAGDVQRVQARRPAPMARGMVMAMADAEMGFEQQSFFEYHLYTLPRPATLPANSTQQLALFPPVSGIAVRKELLYAPTLAYGDFGRPMIEADLVPGDARKVSVFLILRNAADNRLGMPLPAGKVRVSKQDPADGTLEFIGEDLIGHTPRNETIRLRLGDSFDVVGERKVVDFSVDNARRFMSETIEIELRNQKAVPQEVVVRERLYRWRNAKVVESTPPQRKISANELEWTLDIPAEGVGRVRYRVEYTW
jgi:hypothetical protein